jgi:C-methyltransferase
MDAREPHEIVWMLTMAYVPSRCMHVIAELGVADHIGDEAVPAAELAARCGADAGALARVLRLLAMHGVFARDGDGFRHTPASRLLRSDHPMSMSGFPRMQALPVFTPAYEDLEHSVRTGAPAVQKVAPDGLWAYFEDHPGEAEIFGHAMTARAEAYTAAVLNAYDFATIADVGGGRGHLLRAILDATPGARGVLCDLPDVIDGLDLEDERITVHAGDFFADPLPAADAYVLMEVLHDWPDADGVAILSAIRRAAAPGATVLIVENVLPDDGDDPRGVTLDVVMLAVTGGRERTSSQLGELFTRAGLQTGATVETAGPLRIVEAAVP